MARAAVIVLLSLALGSISSQPVDPNDNFFVDKLLGLIKTTPEPPKRPNGRIIGGDIISNRCKPPYNAMVALQLKESEIKKLTICSGVMISPRIVLTAASCLYPFQNVNRPALTAIVGEQSYSMRDFYQQDIPVFDFKIHPDYNFSTNENNVALINLAQEVDTNVCVQSLPRFPHEPTDYTVGIKNCTMTGWGAFSLANLAQNSEFPRSGNIYLLDEPLSCSFARMFYPNETLQRNTLLALTANSTLQACLLDMGGMVACPNDNGDYELHGIIAKPNCFPADSDLPLFVTNLENFKTWINSCVTNFANYCPSLPRV